MLDVRHTPVCQGNAVEGHMSGSFHLAGLISLPLIGEFDIGFALHLCVRCVGVAQKFELHRLTSASGGVPPQYCAS